VCNVQRAAARCSVQHWQRTPCTLRVLAVAAYNSATYNSAAATVIDSMQLRSTMSGRCSCVVLCGTIVYCRKAESSTVPHWQAQQRRTNQPVCQSVQCLSTGWVRTGSLGGTRAHRASGAAAHPAPDRENGLEIRN
jgi:hypothetical protein